MFYSLFPILAEYWGGFNLFRYLTFRTGGATLTALIICFYIGPPLISWLRERQQGQSNVREDTPDTHLAKIGTPSMGGMMILISLAISLLLWADLSNPTIWIVALVTFGFGLVGMADDLLKLKQNNSQNNSKGLSGKLKLLFQAMIGVAAILLYQYLMRPELSSHLALPFFKYIALDMGFLFIPFALIVLIGASNAVNLTDGLDGLAIGPVMIAAVCFGFIAYLVGNQIYSDYLQIFYVDGAGEMAVLCGAMIGGGLGFLWFNAPPAQIFMGDTGSLALGGALGAIAMVTKHEIVLAIIGGLFVLEAVSVIVQVASFKLTGKRVFRMAPLHHHFEKKGWSEPTIVIRFWIIAIVLAMVGLATLKLR